MRRLRALLILAAALAPAQVLAQTIVTSERPESLAVTVYRNPDRPPDRSPELRWLGGYALISETRTVAIPAGESVIRFEGVASGAFAETAIITGLDEAMIERNRDAELLSARTLLDRSLSRRVHVRHTLGTGEVRMEQAILRSGADGAVVLQTADGFEALRCTGLPETIVYDEVPEGLNARPTLSVRLRSRAATTATVTLSYLAAGFDWQANYVATLSPDGRRLDLFAWLTLASMDDTSFPNATTQAVAGQPNREDSEREPSEAAAIQLRCWPQGRTHQIRPDQIVFGDEDLRGATIVVTGSLVRGFNLDSSVPIDMLAEQEDLGDLKLYRIPEPVTVAARSQKQVALLRRERVAVRQLYRLAVGPGDIDEEEPVPANWVLLTRNLAANGLGLPLPAGRIILFGAGAARPVVLGASATRDIAVGEEVELPMGPATGVLTRLRRLSSDKSPPVYELIVTNDHRRSVEFEAELDFSSIRTRSRLIERDGGKFWRVRVPAQGRAVLRFGT